MSDHLFPNKTVTCTRCGAFDWISNDRKVGGGRACSCPPKVEGAKLIAQSGPNEAIVAMTEYRGRILIATSRGVFRLSEDGTQFEELGFVAGPPVGDTLADSIAKGERGEFGS